MQLSRKRKIEVCELCGGKSFLQVAEPDVSGSAVLMCETCTLFFASPTLELEAFNQFYDQEFTGDAGSKAAVRSGKKDNSKKDAKRAIGWALPIVQNFVPDLRGKRILDLRSRDGALAKAMSDAGAIVTASDPMEDNVAKALKRDLDAVYLPIVEHGYLRNFEDQSFDVFTALTIHLMSHLPQPQSFLCAALRVLKPGGLLILDEKDVLKPHRVQSNTVFDDVGGHLFQFTFETLRKMVLKAGFEIVMYSYEPPRFSKFRHMVMVARRPMKQVVESDLCDFPSPDLVLQNLKKAQRFLWIKAPINRALKSMKRFL